MLRRFVLGLGLFVAAVLVIFMLGPRVSLDTTIRFDDAAIGVDPDAYLARTEADVPNLREGHAKEIVWADPLLKSRTPLSIVYIHGFSASKFEIRPVPDRVAAAFGANLYFARLRGHGQDGAAMATATVRDWMDDLAEALSIGRLIGERVVVIATSTGGGIATVGLARPELARDVAATILLSPNYEVRAAGSSLLTMPWGRQIATLVAGRERSFEPANESHARYWTTRYPIDAVLPMAAVTRLAAGTRVEDIAVPALFLISDRDGTVSPEKTREIAARWGARHDLVAVPDPDNGSNHVIAGDALAPGRTEWATRTIVDWLKTVL